MIHIIYKTNKEPKLIPHTRFVKMSLKLKFKKLKTTCWRNDVFAFPAAVSRTGSEWALLQVLLLHIAAAMSNTTHIQDVTLHGTLWLTTAVLAATWRKESLTPSCVTASHHMRTTGRWRCNTICGRLRGKHVNMGRGCFCFGFLGFFLI